MHGKLVEIIVVNKETNICNNKSEYIKTVISQLDIRITGAHFTS